MKHTQQQPPDYILKDWPLWPVLNQVKAEEAKFEQLEQGLTNENWLISHKSIPNQQFVLRINAKNAKQLHIDHQAELEITRAIQPLSLCPDITYYHPDNHYWVRPYIQGLTLGQWKETSGKPLNLGILNAITNSLKFTHNTRVKDHWPIMSITQRLEFFWKQIFHLHPDNKDFLDALKTTVDSSINAEEPAKHVLCHMDCNINNWILNKQNMLYLIDWEYSALGNPAWDLAVICDSAQLDDSQINYMLNIYGDITLNELTQARKEMKYLEILWFAVQDQTPPEQLSEQLDNAFK